MNYEMFGIIVYGIGLSICMFMYMADVIWDMILHERWKNESESESKEERWKLLGRINFAFFVCTMILHSLFTILKCNGQVNWSWSLVYAPSFFYITFVIVTTSIIVIKE